MTQVQKQASGQGTRFNLRVSDDTMAQVRRYAMTHSVSINIAFNSFILAGLQVPNKAKKIMREGVDLD